VVLVESLLRIKVAVGQFLVELGEAKLHRCLQCFVETPLNMARRRLRDHPGLRLGSEGREGRRREGWGGGDRGSYRGQQKKMEG